jgi:hypothetical protein
LQHDPNRPEDVLKVDADEDGVGGDDAADAMRYLVATSRAVVEKKLVGACLGTLHQAVEFVPTDPAVSVHNLDVGFLPFGMLDSDNCVRLIKRNLQRIELLRSDRGPINPKEDEIVAFEMLIHPMSNRHPIWSNRAWRIAGVNLHRLKVVA